MSTVLLFGAGASFGAGGIEPHAPPLGAQLYPALTRVYPSAWGALPADAAQIFIDQGFEAGMAYTWQRYSQMVSVLQKALGHYFARFYVRSNHTCAYRSLISGLGLRSASQSVMLSTLNYDLVLDVCLQVEQIRFGLRSGAEQITLNKPHGASNIFNDSVRATAGVMFTAGVSFSGGDVKAVPQQEALQRNGDPNSAIPPVLAIFMQGKPCQTSPGLLLSLQQEFKSAVLSASRIGVIGVHPHPVDTHIWQPLAQTHGEIFYCGDESAFSGWVAAHRGGAGSHFLGSRFADCVPSLVSALKD